MKILLLTAALLLAGCASPAVRSDHASRLIARPDFRPAAAAAPEWVSDALKTINRLEYEIERR